MPITDAIVIGAGQAGLATSRCLSDRGVEHVVLERGRVAERWRSERWDSLRLLSPNWMSRLPGWSYRGLDPHGYMTAAEVVDYFQGYADASAAPVREDSAVEYVRPAENGFEVLTSTDCWLAANVVVATGWCDRPAVPAMAAELSPRVAQVAPSSYRNPAQLAPGGVLVVGASATGVQLADELAGAGRDVVLAVGSHSRMPRTYRGMDIFWWLERTGSLDRSIDDLPDPVAARREPSVQLVGRPDHRTLDLNALRAAGVELTGHLTGIDDRRVGFADDLVRTAAVADQRMLRVLAEIDAHIEATGLASEVLEPEAFAPTIVRDAPTSIDLAVRGIGTVIWATGFRRTYPWLHVPVLDGAGEIAQRRGVTAVPGIYVVGQRFQHHRSSNFIDGVGRDAAFIADHLDRRIRAAGHPAPTGGACWGADHAP